MTNPSAKRVTILHSDMSLLDGFAKVSEYAEYSKAANQKYLCITDHGVMGAVPQMVAESEKHALKPLFGIEFYINSMQPKVEYREQSAEFRKGLGTEEEQKKFDKSNHLLAIAKNDIGYSNLVRLSTWAWMHGFYRRPRINHEILNQYKEGIIFTSTCANSEIANAFFAGGDEAGMAMVQKYIDFFGKDNFYLELMMLDFKLQKPYDEFLLKAKEHFGLECILSTDCHYCKKEHSLNQRLMLMIQNNRTVQEIEALVASGAADDLFELQDSNLWMKTEDEMNEIWEQKYQDTIDYEIFKQAKANTVKVSELCAGVQLDRSIKLPVEVNEKKQLMSLILEGVDKRKVPTSRQYLDRIKEEYQLICNKGFASYFLIQHKMVQEAMRICPEIYGFNDSSVARGPGRGCLSPNTPIEMENGTSKSIADVVIGDYIWTIDGSLQRVENVLEYDIEEPLVKIRTYYGDSEGVTLTHDHEVLCEKASINEKWLSASEFRQTKVRKYNEPTGDLSWMPAEKIEEGDWCFVPHPQVKTWSDYTVDLSEFAYGNSLNGRKLTYCDHFVRHEGNSPKSGRTLKVTERFWTLTEDWARILGLYAGDGWTRSNDSFVVGFCDDSREIVNLNFVEKIMTEHGYHPYFAEKENSHLKQLMIYSPYLHGLFKKLHPEYKCRPETKHVPDCIINAPLPIVEAYLNGYFLSDGSEGDNKIKFETVSRKLAQQIRFLLRRIGLPSSLTVTQRTDEREEFSNLQPSYIVVCPKDKRLGCSRDAEKSYFWKPCKNGFLLKVLKKEEITGVNKVYDLTVANNHNYLTSSFLVHNSVGGSLVAYCLDIHDLDPIKHDLLFSRFLSPARGGKQMKIRFTQNPCGG